MHIGLVLLICVIIYAAVNGAIMSLLLNHHFKLTRWRSLFNDIFFKTCLSLGYIVGAQLLFFVYCRRIVCLGENWLGVEPDRYAATTHLFALDLRLPILVIIGLLVLLLQFFFISDEYEIDEALLLAYLLVSNSVASIVKYGLLHII